jgi:hypothetical protein
MLIYRISTEKNFYFFKEKNKTEGDKERRVRHYIQQKPLIILDDVVVRV